jgi:hypothetical protein
MCRLVRVLAAIVCMMFQAAEAAQVEWVRQLGSDEIDESRGVAADGLGNVYISGATWGGLGGFYGDQEDVFVSKYDATGVMQWTRKIATNLVDQNSGVSSDGLGGIYVSGTTGGFLDGFGFGGNDAFLSKFNEAGDIQWTRQFGTLEFDGSSGVSADSLGNVYLSGSTTGSLGGPHAGDFDAFVSKYDSSGILQWTRQIGTSTVDSSNGVSADGLGNVYIAGRTWGSLGANATGGDDAFVSKFNAAGELQWTQQLGTVTAEHFSGVSTDGLGNVYLSGTTWGSLDGLNAGMEDAFLSKYDGAGVLQWTRQFGTSDSDEGNAVSSDGFGNVYLAGTSSGTDSFVTKYDANGVLQWTRYLETQVSNGNYGVSADGLGSVYFSGIIEGGPSGGMWDALVGKVIDIPEPSSIILALALPAFAIAVRRSSRRGL